MENQNKLILHDNIFHNDDVITLHEQLNLLS